MVTSGFKRGVTYYHEQWLPLNYNGAILNDYAISNYGRIYSHLKGRFLDFNQDKDGYFICGGIKIGEKDYRNIRVHRSELLSFCPIPIDEYRKMVVNHIDGNNQNNMLWNLEWVYPIDNTRHGWDIGLNQNIGINNGNAIHEDETVHKICQLLDHGLSNAAICDAFGITGKENRMRFSATVSGIKHGKTHRNISQQYNFLNGIDTHIRYSTDFAYLVCMFLSDENRQYTYKEIMDLLQIPDNERVAFKIYIDDLVRGRTAKDVTSQFKLKSPLHDKIDSYLMS